MNQLGIALGFASFLLLAATGQSITFAFAGGVAVLVIVSGVLLQKPKRKSTAKKKAKAAPKKKAKPKAKKSRR